MSRRALTGLAAAGAALALAGCVSVFPQTKPVRLYELTPEMQSAPPAAPGRTPVDVRLVSVRFQQAAAGDRMLTVRDGEAAYIGGARWVSPAETLFEEDLARAFGQHATGVRLVSHSALTGASYDLSLDVDTFQVRMNGATPTVETALRARLVRSPDNRIVLDKRIEVTRTADADRVSSIVRAYDSALGAALSSLVAATDEATARP